ncbi:MAG: helix-turn-helix transcriptional regulator, partial [Thermomicrobiales bacterium]
AVRPLARLLPELGPAATAPAALPPEHEKRRLFEEFAHLFIRFAHDHPLLVLMEDVHWADATSLELLQLLARRLRTTRALIVVTARSDEPGGVLDHWLGGMQRNRLITEQRLRPLSEPDVAKMIAATLDTPLATPVVAAINRRAEGNPFLVEELLHALIDETEQGGASSDYRDAAMTGHIPVAIAETVTRRLDGLDPQARAVAAVAAVAGRHFSFDLLRTLTGFEEIVLTDALRQLIAAQLIIEVWVHDERLFAFRHALTRDAIYARALGPELRRLHHRVARAFAMEPTGMSRLPDGELGHHYFMAEEWQAALEYCRRAGEEAQALYAPRAAIEHFSRALVAARHIGAPHADILLQRGQAYEWIGDTERPCQDYESVLAHARAIGDRATEWRALVRLGILSSMHDYSGGRAYYQQAYDLAEAIGDPAFVARSLNRLGHWCRMVSQPFEAKRYHQEALARFQGIENPHGIAETLTLLGYACYLCGDLVQGIAYHRQAVKMFEALDDRPNLIQTLAAMTESDVTDILAPVTLRIADYVPDTERALHLAEQSGWRFGEAYCANALAKCVDAQGEYGRGLHLAQRALEIAEEIDNRVMQYLAHFTLGVHWLDLLARARAQRHLDRAHALAHALHSTQGIVMTTALLASSHIATNDLARAETLLHPIYRPDNLDQLTAQRHVWLVRAELALAQNEARSALRIGDDLIASAPNIETLGGRGIPRIDLLRGEALAALGRYEEAEQTLRTATETARAQGALPLLWRVHRAAGNCYQKMKRQTAAAGEFGAAMRIIEELAASVPDEHTRVTFVRHAHASLPRAYVQADRRAVKQQFGGLTAREREVVVRISVGGTNREIAEALFVTEKTVELHVTHSLRKLGFRSRTELAAWAVSSGLAASHAASGDEAASS